MKPVFTMPDDHFAMCAGFDALTFVRFYGLCMKVCFFASVLCICIILPLNYTGSGTETRTGNYVDFDKTTSINVENGSVRLWGHILVMAAITLGTLWVRPACAVAQPCRSVLWWYTSRHTARATLRPGLCLATRHSPRLANLDDFAWSAQVAHSSRCFI